MLSNGVTNIHTTVKNNKLQKLKRVTQKWKLLPISDLWRVWKMQ